MFIVDRSAVILKPAEAFLQWLRSCDADMPDITLAQLQSNCTTILIPEFDTPEEAMGYIGEHCTALLEAELSGWEEDRSKWPAELSPAVFWQFFTAEVNDTVLDLAESDIMLTGVAG